MGGAAARHLIAGGRAVDVCDVDTTLIARLADDVAATGDRSLLTVAEQPGDMRETCFLILLFLPTPHVTRTVLTAPSGVFAPDAGVCVVADMGTVGPDFSLEMHHLAERHGLGYLDAPILGRPQAVGRWVLSIGGSDGDLAVAKDTLSRLAASVVHAGGPGSGNKIKLLNQLMFGAINAATAEIMAIADRIGVSHELFYNTLSGSSAATVSGLFKELGRRVVDEDYADPTFTVDLLVKDVRLAAQMARDGGAAPILARTVETVNEMAQGQGLGASDTAEMWKAVRRSWSKG